MRQNNEVLISGASFAGLTTPYYMNKVGYRVSVVEVGTDLKKRGGPQLIPKVVQLM